MAKVWICPKCNKSFKDKSEAVKCFKGKEASNIKRKKGATPTN